jgi:signal transduction histidine kinase
VRQLALLSFVLTVLGAAVAWVLARRLTQPLVRVTRAAEAVASGDYRVRVPASGPDEVARLATSFNRMAEQVGASVAAVEQREGEMRALAEAAESANRAKSDFLATMSHELRTPLNAIGGYVELLDMELRGPVSDAQRRDLARIRASQEHLLGLISAVLDLSRIEAGRVTYDLAPLAVDPVLAGIDALVAPQAAAKSIVLVYAPCPPDLGVLADREKLRQILLNLLSNAIRHTPPAGTVSLAAVASPQTVEISVSDTGPGIPLDRQAAIFEPFVQLDRSLTRTRDGVGLGLAISRDLARGMRGDLTVESRPEHGARFVVTLPRVTPDVASLSTSGETEAVRLPRDGVPATSVRPTPAR